ncbi:MAG: hypothetical protein JSS09_09895, partial [Verrucomicrobia bacterium]|nr:hypothetical protein [Verrucomicrobiota bacterium]
MNIAEFLGLGYLGRTISPLIFGSETYRPSSAIEESDPAVVFTPIRGEEIDFRKTSSPPFQIKEITPCKDRSEVIKTLRSWSTLSFEAIPPQEEKQKFIDSTAITHSMSKELKKPLNDDKVFVCSDQQNRSQSIALVRNNGNNLHIVSFVTNPNNLSSSVELSPNPRVKGAGTVLIHHLF